MSEEETSRVVSAGGASSTVLMRNFLV